jgi:hypothetical protein
MNPRGNPAPLAEARRRDSLAKRQRVLEAIATLEQAGDRITHTAVAQTAGVWRFPPSGGHLIAPPAEGQQKVIDYGDEGIFA